MNKLIAIAKLMILENIRDKSFWMQLIVVPILLTLIMGVAFGGNNNGPTKVKLVAVDKDNSTFSKLFIDQIKKDKVFSIKVLKESEARLQVKKRLVSGAVVIPADYSEKIVLGEKVEVEVLTTAGDNNAILFSQVIAGLTNRYAADAFAARKVAEGIAATGQPSAKSQEAIWEEAFKAADKKWDPAPVTVDAKAVTKSEVRGEKTLSLGFNQSSMGFTITFIMFMLVGGAATILEERQKGTLGRLLTSPTRKSTFISGKMLGLFGTASVQAAILIIAGQLIFKVDWGRDPLPLLVLFIAFIFSIASMGILIAALARTSAQINSTTPIAIISMAMIGGCYWPIEITPPIMQAVAKLIPAGWMMRGLTDLITRGYGWDAIIIPSLVLLGFGAAFLTIGVALLKYE